MIYIILITIVTYLGMIFFTKHRTSIAFISSGLLLVVGGITSTFDPELAFAKFPGDIITLIIVLAIFTHVFNEHGLINLIGYKILSSSNKNNAKLMMIIPIIMYATSLFMNNLTVVLLFTYMALYLALELQLPIVPLLVSIVIGSNIGGAPLPWADTPAVILTLYSEFTLIDFLNKLFIPCLIYAIILALYTYKWYKKSPYKRCAPYKEKPDINWKEASGPIILFIIYTISISIAPFKDISIAYVSLIFGGILLLIQKQNQMDLLNSLPIMDSLVFIIALFLIGGALEYSGILKAIAEYVISFTSQNEYLITISVLLIAFTIATFLSAGPAAATLLPICASLSHIVPFRLIYAALALGILAGSSMLPWSATGGPILMSQTRRFMRDVNVGEEERLELEKIYNIKSYLSFSIPFSLIMLTLSAIYLVIYISICN